ncbi:hypothetical protein N2152v2_000246 [Parachlorella kessleri]
MKLKRLSKPNDLAAAPPGACLDVLCGQQVRLSDAGAAATAKREIIQAPRRKEADNISKGVDEATIPAEFKAVMTAPQWQQARWQKSYTQSASTQPRVSALTSALRGLDGEQTHRGGKAVAKAACAAAAAVAVSQLSAVTAAATVSQLSAATAALASSMHRVDSTGFFELLEFPTVG